MSENKAKTYQNKAPESAPARGPGRNRGPASMAQLKGSVGSLKRVLKIYLSYFPKLIWVIFVCILVGAVTAAVPSIFQQKIIAIIENTWKTGDWAAARPQVLSYIIPLVCLYVVALALAIVQSQVIAHMTQTFLARLREDLFEKMQRLPLKYFDTHKHGEIMSHYTNDIDTLRQLVSMAVPNILRAIILLVTVFGIMLYYSVWMTLILCIGIVLMIVITGKVGAGSAKYFIRQQKAVAAAEGFIQETINGQKVVKVFNHENQAIESFEELNKALMSDSGKANAYANILAPIINNIGNIVYVLLAAAGGIMIYFNTPNLSISGLPFGIAIMIPFLNMCKQFMANLNQLTMQMNAIVMAGAGAERIFALLDQEPETDDGYVTLVNANIGEDGTITEADHVTGHWAWKHPHQADGTITYTELKGDVVFEDVTFGKKFIESGGKGVLTDNAEYCISPFIEIDTTKALIWNWGFTFGSGNPFCEVFWQASKTVQSKYWNARYSDGTQRSVTDFGNYTKYVQCTFKIGVPGYLEQDGVKLYEYDGHANPNA